MKKIGETSLRISGSKVKFNILGKEGAEGVTMDNLTETEKEEFDIAKERGFKPIWTTPNALKWHTNRKMKEVY